MSDDKLLQRLTTDLAPRTAALEKENEAQKPAMQDVINKLSDAIRAMDQPLMRRLTKVLESQVAVYASLVNRASRLVEELGAITSDDRDALKRVDGLRQKAAASHGKITGNYTKLKQLLDMAHKKATDPAVSAVMSQWAEMESWMTTQKEVALIRVRQMETLVELARSAIAAGDDRSLAQAREKAKVRATWKPTQLEIGDKYTKFCNGCEKALGKDLQDELKRDIAKFRRMVTELAELNDKLDRCVATLGTLKMPAARAAKPATLDFRKAAGVLGVDEAKLKKAWAAGSAAPEKALDGLAKEATPKTTGKAMLAALRKSKLLE